MDSINLKYNNSDLQKSLLPHDESNKKFNSESILVNISKFIDVKNQIDKIEIQEIDNADRIVCDIIINQIRQSNANIENINCRRKCNYSFSSLNKTIINNARNYDEKIEVNNIETVRKKSSLMPRPEFTSRFSSKATSPLVPLLENIKAPIVRPPENFKRNINKSLILPEDTNFIKLYKIKLKSEKPLYSFKKVYDSISDSEGEEIKHDICDKYKKSYSINPQSYFSINYQQFKQYVMFFCIIYYPIAFALVTEYTIICFCIDFVIFLINLLSFIIKLTTGLISEKDDSVIYNIKRSFKHAIYNRRLYLDILILCSFTFLVTDYLLIKHTGTSFKIIKAHFLINSLITIKFLKYLNISNHFKDNYYNSTTSKTKKNKNKVEKRSIFETEFFQMINRVLKLIVVLYVIIHILSCFWLYYPINNITTSNNNWVIKSNININNTFEVYIASFYFIMTTVFSIGYGNIYPIALEERIFSIFLLICGVFIYSIIISSLSELFKHRSEKKEVFQYKINTFNKIKSEFKLKKDFEDKINNALLHGFNSYNKDIINIVESLPGSLKNHIYTKMYDNKIKNLYFLKGRHLILFFMLFLFFKVIFTKGRIY